MLTYAALKKNISNLKELLTLCKISPNVIAISETKLKKSENVCYL